MLLKIRLITRQWLWSKMLSDCKLSSAFLKGEQETTVGRDPEHK